MERESSDSSSPEIELSHLLFARSDQKAMCH